VSGYTDIVMAYSWSMLKQDANYPRIGACLEREILETALDCGEKLERRIRKDRGKISAAELCDELRITVRQAELTYPGKLIRAVYTREPREIKINSLCVPVLADKIRQLSQPDGQSGAQTHLQRYAACGKEAAGSFEVLATELILAHEIFHDYERREPALNPQLDARLTWGRWFKRRIRVRSLSEIAAHRFAQVFTGLPFFPGRLDIFKDEGEVLAEYNAAKTAAKSGISS